MSAAKGQIPASPSLLPQEPSGLWAYLAGLPQDDLLKLLAVAIAPAMNALRMARDSREQRGDLLAKALDLDMAGYWTVRADRFPLHISKGHVLSAVRESVSENAARRIEHLKKPDMAKTAEGLLKDRGWLPEPLRR